MSQDACFAHLIAGVEILGACAPIISASSRTLWGQVAAVIDSANELPRRRASGYRDFGRVASDQRFAAGARPDTIGCDIFKSRPKERGITPKED